MFDFVSGMEEVTPKQIAALVLIAPGPIWHGLSYREAADRLGISKASFIERLKGFKDRFPEAWENLQSMRKAASRQRESLNKPLSLDILGYEISENEIKDRF